MHFDSTPVIVLAGVHAVLFATPVLRIGLLPAIPREEQIRTSQ